MCLQLFTCSRKQAIDMGRYFKLSASYNDTRKISNYFPLIYALFEPFRLKQIVRNVAHRYNTRQSFPPTKIKIALSIKVCAQVFLNCETLDFKF